MQWAGRQPWSNGNVGMLGVSYLALTQYKTAALSPTCLKAICPWEGFTDAYRDFMVPGGIEERGFSRIWQAATQRAARLTEDFHDARRAHPLRDAWWAALAPHLEQITVPMLVCASFSDANLHSLGSFRAFERVGSSERFAYLHRGPKWSTFYGDDAKAAQLTFFDRYLRGQDVTELPRVRLEVREDRNTIAAVRTENQWPLERTRWTPLYLGGGGRLTTEPTTAGSTTFDLRRNAAVFGLTFACDTEVTGPMTLTVWASSDVDANLFVGVDKIRDGHVVPFEGSYGYGRDRLAIGRLRMSMRDLDDPACTPHLPVHSFTARRPITPKEPVRLDIPLSPSATVFRAGDGLRLAVGGRYLEPRNPLFGSFPARYRPSPVGRCTLHWSAEQPAHLDVPIIG